MGENKVLDSPYKTQMNSKGQRAKSTELLVKETSDGYGHDARIGDVKR
jgi:hypothetical protein